MPNSLWILNAGCLDGICAQWVDLETDADAIIAKHGPQGPTERLREVAGKYAAALWTKRQAEKLRILARLGWAVAWGYFYENFP